MKSLTAVCQTGASMPAINPNGRIARHPHHRGDGENAEMKMYLSKLKDLVPFMPKNRKLSKLEIIQHVIDYICDLQSELETHPEIGNFDAASALNFVTSHQHDDDDDEEDEDEDMLNERLSVDQHHQQQQQHHQQQQQQLQHSSPATRQPLVDRQTPNTILPSSMAANFNAAAALTAAAVPAPVQHQAHQTMAPAQSSQTPSAEKDSRQPC